MTGVRNIIWALAIASIIIGCDQISKTYILYGLDLWHRPPITVTSFFNLVLVWNRGVSFGMFADAGGAITPYLIMAVKCGIIGLLIFWVWHEKHLLSLSLMGSVIGGALGNMWDRAHYGAVVDFLDFHMLGYHWPAFNVADSAICIGVLALLWIEFRKPSA